MIIAFGLILMAIYVNIRSPAKINFNNLNKRKMTVNDDNSIKITPIPSRQTHVKIRSKNKFFENKSEFVLEYDEYSLYLFRPKINDSRRIRNLVSEGGVVSTYVNTFTDLNVEEICGEYTYDDEDSTEDQLIFNKL